MEKQVYNPEIELCSKSNPDLNSQPKPLNVSDKIAHIFEQNKLSDLQGFISRRHCLNTCNIFLVYFFHVVQSAGILTTTIAAGYSIKELVWVGVGLNILASLIHIFEKTNNNISKKLLDNIKDIKANNYIDQNIVVLDTDLDPEQKKNQLNYKSQLIRTNQAGYGSTNNV